MDFLRSYRYPPLADALWQEFVVFCEIVNIVQQ